MRELRPRMPAPPVAVTLDSPDTGYMIAVGLLFSVGLIMVYSTTAVNGIGELKKMFLWMAVGIPGLLLALKIPMAFWRKWAPWVLAICLVALASLLLKSKNPLAISVNGAYRWLKLPGGQLQPSEFAKLAYILFAARFLERWGQRMDSSRWTAFLVVLGLLGGLIYKEPDLGTAMCIGGAAFCMLVAAGVRWRPLAGGIVVVVVLVSLLTWFTQHQRDRLMAWQNPWDPAYAQDGGYQVIRSWSAMARGGLWGAGLGQSIYKLGDRLPEAETDFIFAIVGEEMGLVRGLAVIGVFGLLVWRGYTIAARAPDRYTGLIAVGITSWIAVQAVLNLAVVTGTVPNTGVPLPFISKGGSSLTVLLVATGIMIHISRQRAVKPEQLQ